MPRTTADTIAIILALTVGIVVIMTTLVLLFQRLQNPTSDPLPTAQAVGMLISVIIGLLGGYIAGKKANGH